MARPRNKNKPSLDDPGMFESLCNHIALGNSLRSWCEKHGIGSGHAVEWIQADSERHKVYREARRLQADMHIDQLIELADTEVPRDEDGRIDSGAVNQLRLRVDTRKWVASKFYPALYGDRVAVDANVVDGREQTPVQVMAKIVTLLGSHGFALIEAPKNDVGPEQGG